MDPCPLRDILRGLRDDFSVFNHGRPLRDWPERKLVPGRDRLKRYYLPSADFNNIPV
jgi:hypothetical protein